MKGLKRDIPKMWNNAHPAAKTCLGVAGGITAFPAVDAAILYNNRNPENVTDFIKGFQDVAPIGPGSTAYNAGNVVRGIVNEMFR